MTSVFRALRGTYGTARGHRIAPVPGALSFLLLWGLAGCTKPASSNVPSGPQAVAVEIVTVAPGSIRDVIDLVGQLESEESVELKSETEGIVESVAFQEGDAVTRGALLFRLRDDEQQARLREAEAQERLAREEYERVKTLATQKTVSQSELDKATATWQAAVARRDLARVALQRMEIRAPFDGVLGARHVSPGDRVDDETSLVRIDAVDRLRLLFTVPEMGVRAVHVGDAVEIRVVPWPDERFPGKVYFVAPSVDPRTRRLLLKAWVPNPDRRLRPGLFTNIQLEIAHRDDALVIPESAIAYDAQGPFVWRVDGQDTAERVAVTLGIRKDGRVQVTSGLRTGDRVVSAGTHKVAPGALLKVATPPAAQSPPNEARGSEGANGQG